LATAPDSKTALNLDAAVSAPRLRRRHRVAKPRWRDQLTKPRQHPSRTPTRKRAARPRCKPCRSPQPSRCPRPPIRNPRRWSCAKRSHRRRSPRPLPGSRPRRSLLKLKPTPPRRPTRPARRPRQTPNRSTRAERTHGGGERRRRRFRPAGRDHANGSARCRPTTGPTAVGDTGGTPHNPRLSSGRRRSIPAPGSGGRVLCTVRADRPLGEDRGGNAPDPDPTRPRSHAVPQGAIRPGARRARPHRDRRART
jgi:hypothetical protein